ncbi:MAG TPA: AMP-binding protein [Bryobacteraceae bacterium]|nr:AMP-binding protein [Bryobacteraceae bacterium]
MQRETLLDFFDSFAGFTNEFLIYDNGFRSWRYRYCDVAQAARALAGRLLEAGFGSGAKVILWSENRAEWVVALWGCLLAGAVAVPIDYRSSQEFVLRIQRTVGSHLLLIGDEVEPPASAADFAIWRISKIEWTGPSQRAPTTPHGNDIAEIIFTSGATAEPKGVLITHRNVLANIVPVEREVYKYRRWGRPFFPIRFLNLLPLSHLFGQAMATFIPPMLPGMVVFMHGYNPAEIIQQIHSRRISVLVSVPKILEVLRDHVVRLFPELATAPSDSSHWLRKWWRYRKVHRLFGWKFWSFVVGAAPLPPELEKFWSRLGFLVIQGYGLTETAPIVTLNHPFHAHKGTVGKPIPGVQVKFAEDGEILVRGENVTSGYFNAPEDASFETSASGEKWFHTGDIGSLDEEGRLIIRGRKKEMIVTPEGLNIFPEDVERVLSAIPGVRDSAVVGRDRAHAVLVLEPRANPDDIVRQANASLEEHQKIRGVSVWPSPELPRTEGTRKLKRSEIRRWVEQGEPAPAAAAQSDWQSILSRYSAGRSIKPETTLDELGLSSLERIELMMALDVDEARFTEAQTVGELSGMAHTAASRPGEERQIPFPRWNRSLAARLVRRGALATFLLPLTRVFAWIRVSGRENLKEIEPPVIFAANHQSHMDVPTILAALPPRWRYRVAPAMSKEFFAAHFFPERHSRRHWLTNSLNYYLATLLFNAFPLPQREAGAVEALRYAGELASQGWCVLIFPEGDRTFAGEIHEFQPGVGMMAARLDIPVVPIRIDGLERVLNRAARMAHPGRVSVRIGAPLRFEGGDHAAFAHRLEQAVRAL